MARALRRPCPTMPAPERPSQGATCAPKVCATLRANLRAASRPLWARGLKRQFHYGNGARRPVAPLVGAWIETAKSAKRTLCVTLLRWPPEGSLHHRIQVRPPIGGNAIRPFGKVASVAKRHKVSHGVAAAFGHWLHMMYFGGRCAALPALATVAPQHPPAYGHPLCAAQALAAPSHRSGSATARRWGATTCPSPPQCKPRLGRRCANANAPCQARGCPRRRISLRTRPRPLS